MSYSHTKRRKHLATLKKRFPTKWQEYFSEFCKQVRRENDGPLIGSLQDIRDAKQAE